MSAIYWTDVVIIINIPLLTDLSCQLWWWHFVQRSSPWWNLNNFYSFCCSVLISEKKNLWMCIHASRPLGRHHFWNFNLLSDLHFCWLVGWPMANGQWSMTIANSICAGEKIFPNEETICTCTSNLSTLPSFHIGKQHLCRRGNLFEPVLPIWGEVGKASLLPVPGNYYYDLIYCIIMIL